MIAVQIAPPHPIPHGHLPKHRVRHPEFPSLRKPLNQPRQLLPILGKLHRRSPSHSLLHLRSRRDPMRPLHREIQCAPLRQPPRNRQPYRTRRPLPQRQQKRIAQMANHLMAGHLPPPPSRILPQRSHPLQHLRLIRIQGPHAFATGATCNFSPSTDTTRTRPPLSTGTSDSAFQYSPCKNTVPEGVSAVRASAI